MVKSKKNDDSNLVEEVNLDELLIWEITEENIKEDSVVWSTWKDRKWDKMLKDRSEDKRR